MTARRPRDGVAVYVPRETVERLRAAADERVMGIHALADRLLTVGLDRLVPVDVYGRPAEPEPEPAATPPPRPGEPTMCLLDHDGRASRRGGVDCGPDCPPVPEP